MIHKKANRNRDNVDILSTLELINEKNKEKNIKVRAVIGRDHTRMSFPDNTDEIVIQEYLDMIEKLEDNFISEKELKIKQDKIKKIQRTNSYKKENEQWINEFYDSVFSLLKSENIDDEMTNFLTLWNRLESNMPKSTNSMLENYLKIIKHKGKIKMPDNFQIVVQFIEILQQL